MSYAILWKKISLWTMSFFYFVAGINHFLMPDTYLMIMPPFLPEPLFLVYLSGAAESFLGAALLFPKARNLAAWGIIALLIAIFPANIYMFQLGGKSFGIPHWILIARLPLQGILAYWAYTFTHHSQMRLNRRNSI